VAKGLRTEVAMDELTNEKLSNAHEHRNGAAGCDQPFEVLGFILDCADQEEVLRYISGEMHRHGLVVEEYGSAVVEREKEFPTGLSTEPVCVAIPHSDKKYARRAGVAVARVERPIVFKNMGAPDEDVDVELILLLAVPPEEDQVLMIQTIVETVQDQETLVNLMEATTEQELVSILQRRIGRRTE
jgi:PTS system galactitol-specific IIA component